MMLHSNRRLRRACLVLAAAVLGTSPLAAAPAFAGGSDGHAPYGDHGDRGRDPVVLSFSTVGDSRQDPQKADPTTRPVPAQDRIWLQNSKAWSRIIRSIQQERSDFLFFNGDMIMGFGDADVPADTSTVAAVAGSDLMQFYREYAFWRGMVAGLMETGTYVVPVPGNHEVQCKPCGKKALAVNENAWRANMGDLILDDARMVTLLGEGPAYEDVSDTGPADGLATDQSKLSYSFDFRGSHFAVINTDAVGDDAHAPVNWLKADLAAAQARGMQHMFVFGHKPAFTYYFGTGGSLPDKPAGLDGDPAARDAFWQVIEQYHATYFCGHEHIFHMEQPWKARGGKAWQVLVGSGGSPFEAAPADSTVDPATDRDYAWATVDVRRSGRVDVTVFGFDDHYGPTRVLAGVTLPQ